MASIGKNVNVKTRDQNSRGSIYKVSYEYNLSCKLPWHDTLEKFDIYKAMTQYEEVAYVNKSLEEGHELHLYRLNMSREQLELNELHQRQNGIQI